MYCGKRLRHWTDYMEKENNIFISDIISEHGAFIASTYRRHQSKRLQSAKGNATTVVKIRTNLRKELRYNSVTVGCKTNL